MRKILIINGPNINMLGIREVGLYGKGSYHDLMESIKGWAGELGCGVSFFQSNHEGAIVDKIQEAYGVFDGIVINPAAYTHTSVAILDALKAVNLPCVEVHISDVNAREDFRKLSYVRSACKTHFVGMGFLGYKKAIEFLVKA